MNKFLNSRINIIKIFFISLSFFLFLISFNNYVGNKFLYFIFFSLFTFYVCFSFEEKKVYFFDLILSIFLWLGFFFKMTNYLHLNIIFGEGTGDFNFSSESFDKVLIVSSLGCFGFISALSIKKKIKISFKEKLIFIEKIYLKNNIFLYIYFVVSLFFLIINLKFNIYQKGSVSNLEFGKLFRDLFAYYYLIGFPLLTSLIISYELQRKRFNFIYLSIFETFLTSISLISRGMLINLIPYFLAILNLTKKINNFNLKKIIFFIFFIIIFFIFTIVFTNTYRSIKNQVNLNLEINYDYKNLVKTAKFRNDNFEFIRISDSQNKLKKFSESLINPIEHIKYLIFYRWVGIDAVMAVEASKIKDFNLYKSSWMETYEENKLSFYDTYIVKNLDYNLSLNENPSLHVVTLPGFIAHSYYTGSLMFVFLSCFLVSFISFLIILIFNYFTENIFIIAILSNILAYRLIHWGFAPINSINILMSIFITLVLLLFCNHAIKKIFYKK